MTERSPGQKIQFSMVISLSPNLLRYSQPSLEPKKPTEIAQGFIVAISDTDTTQTTTNDSFMTLLASNGKNFHIRGRTVSLLAEHSVVFYEMSVGDAGVLSSPEWVVHANLTVPAPDPENPTQPGSHTANDHYWHCTQLAAGVEACELKFMLINKSCEILGYFSWAVDVKLAE
ncbi:AidA/PixA family protein [Pseudomonas sp. LB3P25]